MPYKRYDLKNKYNRRGRRVNDKIWLNVLLLVLIPVLIVAVVVFGIIVPVVSELDGTEEQVTTIDTSVTEQTDVVSDEQLLQIVNESYPVEAEYKPVLVPFGNARVSKWLFDDLDELVSDAASENINLSVKTAYVSYDEQDKLYKDTFAKIKSDNGYSEIKAESETKKVCPPAGCSEAQTGLLIVFSTDEDGAFEQTQAGKWLSKYSVNYGFILRYPVGEEEVTGRTYRADAYRYVGIEHAKKMRSYNMTLEAYSVHINSR